MYIDNTITKSELGVQPKYLGELNNGAKIMLTGVIYAFTDTMQLDVGYRQMISNELSKL